MVVPTPSLNPKSFPIKYPSLSKLSINVQYMDVCKLSKVRTRYWKYLLSSK